MYEQFKNQFIVSLSNRFSVDDLRIIGSCLDVVSSGYDISKKETSLTVYSQPIPKTVEIYIVSKKISGLSEKISVSL